MALTYTGRRNLFGDLTNNSKSSNLTLGDTLMNQKQNEIYALRDWPFMYATNTSTTTTASTQSYDLPGDLGKLLAVSVTFDSTVYTPKKVPTRQFWERLNQNTSETADSPEWYYVFGNDLLLYPTPSSSSGTITYSYKRSGVDLSVADTTGTLTTATNGDTALVQDPSTWTDQMQGMYIQIALSTTDNTGDGRWYEIGTVNTGTSITLQRPYAGNSISSGSASYTIGQLALLPDNFHVLPVYGAAEVYYTSVKPERNQAQMYRDLYNRGLQQLIREKGQTTSDVAIESEEVPMNNPNFYIEF